MTRLEWTGVEAVVVVTALLSALASVLTAWAALTEIRKRKANGAHT